MGEQSEHTERHWHVLNFIRNLGRPSPRQHIDAFNRSGHALELFAPIIRPAVIVNGKVVFKEKLLTYYYVFVRGALDEIKELCARNDNTLSMMLNRGGVQRYAIIKDADMERFKLIANLHVNSIPFFNIEDIDLERGDKVEIIDGEFAGLRGTFMPKARSTKGNLVIAATESHGTILWDVDAKYVRILEFAKNTRRQYDLLDAFIPRLYPVMRRYFAGEMLSEKDKSQLAVFNSRMGAVTFDNHKLEAKLLAVLISVQTILGDEPALLRSRKRYEKRRGAVTNEWTSALIELLESVTNKDIAPLEPIYYRLIATDTPLTAAQAQLLEEYRHYLTSTC